MATVHRDWIDRNTAQTNKARPRNRLMYVQTASQSRVVLFELASSDGHKLIGAIARSASNTRVGTLS